MNRGASIGSEAQRAKRHQDVVSRSVRKKIVVLMTLWGKIATRDSRLATREARLRWLSEMVGWPVSSAKGLTETELEMCIAILRQQLRRRDPGEITREQLWKLRELEVELGWAGEPMKLLGFIRNKYHVYSSESLSFEQARRAIESLYAVLARGNIKRRKGAGYEVGRRELAAEVRKLKRRGWGVASSE